MQCVRGSGPVESSAWEGKPVSDHRFEIDVTFSIYGEEFHWDASLNWDNHDGVIDTRIEDWFLNCYTKARSGYDTYAEMQRAEEAERWEREQLARLKAKYEPAPTKDGLSVKGDRSCL